MVRIRSYLSTMFEAVLLLLALSLATSFITAHAQTFLFTYCYPNLDYTDDSPFKTNLGRLLYRGLYNEGKVAGFSNRTEGQEPDKVYGLFLCRGDVKPDLCQKCIDVASGMIERNCPRKKEAIIWYDECLVRYSNRYFFSIMEDYPPYGMYNIENVTNPDGFDQTVADNFRNLTAFAVSSSPRKFYATKDVNISKFLTLYELVQCTPDLSNSDCTRCLTSALAYLGSFSSAKRGGRVLQPSCNIRYELYEFHGEPRAQAPPPTSSSGNNPTVAVGLAPKDHAQPPFSPSGNNETVGSGSGSKRRRKTWILISSLAAGGFLLALLGIFVFVKRKDGNMDHSQVIQLLDLSGNSTDGISAENLEGENLVDSKELPLLKLDIVNKATNHFSADNKLGEGGFGPVYKGILADGREIAVKRLSRSSGQGLHELRNEVSLIARLQHRNLVRLLGCCLEKDEKLLIYEYMPNRSLDVFLFDSNLAASLDWKTRWSIIYGVARGLLYLHEDSRLRIIHRDLKASNILLDQNMVPKISDFGMAKIFGGNQDEANTNRVVGTYGYMSPEYAMEGIFSVKSDVFSFGVLLLEIVSGKKNTSRSKEGESLLTYAWQLWCKGQAVELTDPLIRESCDLEQALKCIHIALLCVQEDAADRPTMSLVVHMLVGETTSIPQPTQPAFSVKRLVKQLDQPLAGKDDCTVNQVTLSNVSPR